MHHHLIFTGIQTNTGGVGVITTILIHLIIGIDLVSIIIFTDTVIHMDTVEFGTNGDIEIDLT